MTSNVVDARSTHGTVRKVTALMIIYRLQLGEVSLGETGDHVKLVRRGWGLRANAS
jgi:hypothetical protein